MLDTETKRRIDTARDILVGKVPDPKSQVEQITIALIYKFMDDMDAESEEFDGVRKFFAGEYARYGWAKLMRSGLGGHEMLNLYAEAITKMPENPGIPKLFRDIFKNAYLPYRDPETLRAFLKIIDEFEYDHSERLGDAFEYLLAVLGSQGDAGQFRTPRHIIDFMVAVIDPKKTETLLDPACGTAGFLISSYKHILRANTSTPEARAGDQLTPDERGRLAQNFTGYDISPDMVRLSLVNMYLHGFAAPHIYEYDALTSEERWNEIADVILANPPFMSPKGGIRPHNRFSVSSKRSEVLFVDYMAEHLSPAGRAAIIVPEGVIFQSKTAYKALRKMLVEDYLVAVISLPAGVFQPYSGVKTSILVLDKTLTKKANTVAFFKVESDGFGLGAQRRAIDKNDLPQVQAEIADYLNRLRAGEAQEGFEPTRGLVVDKEKIAESGDYNLSGGRYRETIVRDSSFPLRQFQDVCTLEYGASLPKRKRIDGPYPVIGSNGITGYHNEYLIEGPAIVVGRKGSAGEVTFIEQNCFPIDTTYYVKRTNPDESDLVYLYWVLKSLNLPNLKGGAGIPGLNRNDVYYTHKIPLPPLAIQQEIVAEIEGYQRVIDGARAVLDNYRPHIVVDPEWPTTLFKNAPFEIIDGDRGKNYPKKGDFSSFGYCVFLNTKNVRSNGFSFSKVQFISQEKDEALRKGKLQRNDVVLTTRGTIGNTGFYDESVEFNHIRINSGMLIFRPDITKLLGNYLFLFFQSQNFKTQRNAIVSGAAQPQLPIRSLNEARLPLPPITTQQAIVAEIKAEQRLVDANRELIARFEKKIQATLTRVWGSEESKEDDDEES